MPTLTLRPVSAEAIQGSGQGWGTCLQIFGGPPNCGALSEGSTYICPGNFSISPCDCIQGGDCLGAIYPCFNQVGPMCPPPTGPCQCQGMPCGGLAAVTASNAGCLARPGGRALYGTSAMLYFSWADIPTIPGYSSATEIDVTIVVDHVQCSVAACRAFFSLSGSEPDPFGTGAGWNEVADSSSAPEGSCNFCTGMTSCTFTYAWRSTPGTIGYTGGPPPSPDQFRMLVTMGDTGNGAGISGLRVTDAYFTIHLPELPPPTCTLSVVQEGTEATLSWYAFGADTATINQGIGSVDTSGGTMTVTAAPDTIFTLTVSNSTGISSCSAAVSGCPLPAECLEVQFPTSLSFRAQGGPGFSTAINEGFSGLEQRNRNWAKSRGKWTVSLMTPAEFGQTRQQFADAIEAFFLTVGQGREASFRFKDHKDCQARAQIIGIGDGSTQTFQLIKDYVIGSRTYTRVIRKPVAPPAVDYLGNALPNTVKVYVDGTLQSAFYLDVSLGVVSLGTAPSTGQIVTADFDFDFPVRFDTDEFGVQTEESNVLGGGPMVSWNSLALIEVRL